METICFLVSLTSGLNCIQTPTPEKWEICDYAQTVEPLGARVYFVEPKKKNWCVLPQITLTCARSVTVPALTLTEMSSSRGWRCKVGTSSPKWRTYYTVFRLREGGLYLCLGVARVRGAPPPEDKIGELWPSEWRQDPNQWPRVLRPHWSPSCLS